MIVDEEPEKPRQKVGLPMWMATFADLMALLLCFFVLLLSFSEMDAMKFKRLAGSMAQAFGVQVEEPFDDVPKGTSIIAQEFSPGRPEPTPINEIFQSTDDIPQMSLEVYCAEQFDIQQGDPDYIDAREQLKHRLEELVESTRQDARALAAKLQPQIAAGQIEIETRGRQIIIRIREQGSFASASADLARDYFGVMEEIRAVLMLQPGRIQVQGHTDSLPISSERFRSNWDLSSARAVSVAHELMRGGYLDERRFQVAGFADTRPLAPNDTAANRARNRRVEVVIQQGLGDELEEHETEMLESEGPDIMRELDLEPDYLFDLEAEEIF
ncbi:MotB family protein [Marinimicrobium sp. ABcell2]|uniref:MotB family protein n=1 Tax=Marinimicrobium sp. ABcell2 TaxID=3069751 RepID=UPI0027B545B4|nr:MotB family protein [Marinimicrobium sp. ABcell2]MDQ2076340.1 MotB family protein [Marinimicrobium sp. ABcell2]